MSPFLLFLPLLPYRLLDRTTQENRRLLIPPLLFFFISSSPLLLWRTAGQLVAKTPLAGHRSLLGLAFPTSQPPYPPVPQIFFFLDLSLLLSRTTSLPPAPYPGPIFGVAAGCDLYQDFLLSWPFPPPHIPSTPFVSTLPRRATRPMESPVSAPLLLFIPGAFTYGPPFFDFWIFCAPPFPPSFPRSLLLPVSSSPVPVTPYADRGVKFSHSNPFFPPSHFGSTAFRLLEIQFHPPFPLGALGYFIPPVVPKKILCSTRNFPLPPTMSGFPPSHPLLNPQTRPPF